MLDRSLSIKYAESIIDAGEGFAATAYLDVLARQPVWTIGHGTTRIGDKPVLKGMVCTKAQADTWREVDLIASLDVVVSVVHAPINPFQAAALTSLCYNIGAGHFMNSDVVTALNHRLYRVAADRFLEFDHAGDKVVHGLTTRRARERACFLTAMGPTTPVLSEADSLNQDEIDEIEGRA